MAAIVVTSARHTLTCRVQDDGCLRVDAISSFFNHMRGPYPIKSNARLAYDAILQCPQKIHGFVDDIHTDILPELLRLRSAVRAVERIMLSPYTYMGRKRLHKEFELFIDDDFMDKK